MDYFKRKKIIYCFSLIFFLLSIFVAYSNLHLHVLNNGFTIVHGHPFHKDATNPSPFQKHHHSNSAFLFIASIISLSGLISWLVIILAILLLLTYLKWNFEHQTYLRPFYSIPTLRAPPVK